MMLLLSGAMICSVASEACQHAVQQRNLPRFSQSTNPIIMNDIRHHECLTLQQQCHSKQCYGAPATTAILLCRHTQNITNAWHRACQIFSGTANLIQPPVPFCVLLTHPSTRGKPAAFAHHPAPCYTHAAHPPHQTTTHTHTHTHTSHTCTQICHSKLVLAHRAAMRKSWCATSRNITR
jgi:hypothetical protein